MSSPMTPQGLSAERLAEIEADARYVLDNPRAHQAVLWDAANSIIDLHREVTRLRGDQEGLLNLVIKMLGRLKVEFKGEEEAVISAFDRALEAKLSELTRLRALADGMAGALRDVNKLIAEGAMTGFRWEDGDWAEKLFNSQQRTSQVLSTYDSDKAGK